jgi:catechol 2,3-dioxygenase-like lactoylglutathione lyase family enzyme
VAASPQGLPRASPPLAAHPATPPACQKPVADTLRDLQACEPSTVLERVRHLGRLQQLHIAREDGHKIVLSEMGEESRMNPRISLITLGVGDLPTSRAFYERLGFVSRRESTADIVFLDTASGLVLALFPRKKLAEDAHVDANSDGTGPSFPGFTLAHNVGSPEAVDAVLAEAVAAGATLQKPGQNVFWGGYSGYFADPDGFLWEVAYNPLMDLT